jgi:hypothetical protein
LNFFSSDFEFFSVFFRVSGFFQILDTPTSKKQKPHQNPVLHGSSSDSDHSCKNAPNPHPSDRSPELPSLQVTMSNRFLSAGLAPPIPLSTDPVPMLGRPFIKSNTVQPSINITRFIIKFSFQPNHLIKLTAANVLNQQVTTKSKQCNISHPQQTLQRQVTPMKLQCHSDFDCGGGKR